MAKDRGLNLVKSQVIYKDYSKDAERTALVSGENLSHMFGKIARWYTDISWVGHTHTEANITDFGTYAGASTKGGAATSANKLNIGSADIGSETKPVYFSYLTGKPVACTYSLNASVPANAVFTDINVKQSPSTADESREVLFAGNTGNTETTGTVGKSNKLYFNPSTGALTATSFSGSIAASNLTGTIDAGRLPTTAVTAGSYGPAAGGTLTYGGTFDVPYVTVDKYGRLTAGSTKTFTMPAQYVHPSTSGNKHIPSGGSSGQYLKWSSDGTATWSTIAAADLPSHTHAYIPLSGSTAVTGEISTAAWNGFRLYNTGVGVIFRKDAEYFYILLTDKKTDGSEKSGETWNNLRPFYINCSTGLVKMANGLNITGGGLTVSTTASFTSTATFSTSVCQINPTGASYNEGLRIGKASNGWSNINFGCSNSATTGTQSGQWSVGARGAVGATSGGIGDFTIEHNGASGTGLTLYANGNLPRWNNKVLATYQTAHFAWDQSSHTTKPWKRILYTRIDATYYDKTCIFLLTYDYGGGSVDHAIVKAHIRSTGSKTLDSYGLNVFECSPNFDLSQLRIVYTNTTDSSNNPTGVTGEVWLKNTKGQYAAWHVAILSSGARVEDTAIPTWELRTTNTHQGSGEGYETYTSGTGSKDASYSGHTHMKYVNGFWGMMIPNGSDGDWIRTSSQGIIPYQSGNAGSGHQSIGTSTWYFKDAYVDTFHGSLSGNASTASKWTTARTLTLTGSVTGSVSIDGSGNVSLATTTNHTHSYLPLSGGTMTGDITFTAVTSTTYPATSNQISFGGSTDGGQIFFEVGAADQGNLVLQTTDDADAKIIFRNKVTSGGTRANQVTICDGVISGNGSGLTNLNASNISSGTLSIDRMPSHTHDYITRNSNITYGASRLQWFDLSGNGTVSASTPYNPGNDWFHHIMLNHGNGNGYYVDFAICFHQDLFYYKRISNGSIANADRNNGWVRIIDSSCIGSQSVASAGKWTTGRTLTIGSTGKSVDGSGNVSWSLSEIGAASSDHNHKVTGTSTDGENTVWSYLAIKDYNNAYPDGMTMKRYGWGEVISLAGANGRLELYANHNSSNPDYASNGIQYRSGWANDKRTWRMLLDNVNYSSYITPAGIGAAASSHTHSYLPLAGGTMTGDITFTGVTSTTYPANSNKLYWSGSTDWAKIYYSVTASDAGKLVLDIGDDTNTQIAFAYNGTIKSYVDTNGTFCGTATKAEFPYGFASRSSSASWAAGGTFVTAWNTGDGCEIAFMKNYPISGQLSCCIDGYFFQNEGKKRVLDESNFSSYITPASIGAAASSHSHSYLPLSGGTLTGNLTIGSSTQSTLPNCGITVHDIRSVNVPASGFANKSANFYFHMADSPDTSKWWSIMHVRGWDGAYCAWELAGTAHNDDARTRPLYVRCTNAASAWGSWRKIYDSSNKPTLSELGAMGAVAANGFWGMATPAGATNDWIRTTSLGIIPYQSGNGGSGHQSLGTSTWYFADAYIDKIHGGHYGSVTTVGADVNLTTPNSSSDDSGDIVFFYGNGQEKMRIWSNNTYTAKAGPNYRVFNSSGTQLYSGTLVLHDGTGASGTWNITASSANKINTNAGSATNPVYFSSGVPVACTYSLHRTVLPNYSVTTGNTANYPFHLLCSMKDTAAGYKDFWAVFRVTPGYDGQVSGVYMVTVRMNNGGAGGIGLKLISGYPYLGDTARVVAGYSTSGTNTYMYVFLKCSTYARTTVSLMLNSGFTFYSSNEVNDTTTSDKKTSTNVYATLAAAGTALIGSSFASTKTSVDINNYANVISATQYDEYNPSSSSQNRHPILFAATAPSPDKNFNIGVEKTSGVTYDTIQGLLYSYRFKSSYISLINGSYTSTISPTTLTADRTITLPDQSGTIAIVGKHASNGCITSIVSEGASSHTAYAAANQSFGGTYTIGGTWYNMISIRHRNGAADGSSYGFYLRNTLTSEGSLIYGQQCGGTWKTEKTLLDSSNYISYIKGGLYTILWSGSTSCTARSSTSITLTTAISANKYRFIKVVWNCGTYTGTSEFRADTLNVTNNIPSGSDATTTNMIQFKIASDGKSVSVGPGTATITVIQIAGVYPI